MSHEILFRQDTGAASLVYVGEIPWHGFGFQVERITAVEAMELIGSDYRIEKVQNVCLSPYDGEIEVVNAYTLWKPPLPMYGLPAEVIGQVGEDYVPIHTDDVARGLDATNGDEPPVTDRWPVVSHGIVSGGTRVFFSLNGGEFEVHGNPVVCFVNIRDVKSGNGAFDISVGGVRMICRNTFEAAGSSALISANVRHTGNATNEINERLKLIAQAQKAMGRMEDECKQMAEVRLTDDDVQTLLEKTFPQKRPTPKFRLAKELETDPKGAEIFRRIHGVELASFLQQQDSGEDLIATYRAGVVDEMNLYNSLDTNEAHGSAWAYFNGVTAYVDHTQLVRGSDESRALYKGFGKGAEAKIRAYAACVDMAKN
jgi:Domain of unknown function (DUF932)